MYLSFFESSEWGDGRQCDENKVPVHLKYGLVLGFYLILTAT
jgi:hypothetical protein